MVSASEKASEPEGEMAVSSLKFRWRATNGETFFFVNAFPNTKFQVSMILRQRHCITGPIAIV